MEVKKGKIEFYMIATLLTYIPFHLFEEALGNFPDWMSHHWTPLKLTYGHWMAGNIFFYYPILVIGILLYFCFGEKYLFTGVGVIVWGLYNFLEHIIYTLIDFKVSPGIITGIVFLIIALLSYIKLKELGKLKLKLIIYSFLIAVVYALLPVMLQIIFSPYFRGIFV